MLNIVSLLIQIGSIVGLVSLIITFSRIMKRRRNILIKAINIFLIGVCIAVIIASGYSLLAGTVSISSDPAGAEVYFDDKFVGITPVIIQNVMAGTHSLMVKKDGYDPAYQMIHVDVQETISSEMSLAKQTGFLRIVADIDGAAVYIDQTLTGYTPMSDAVVLSAGVHEVTLSKENYYDVHEQAAVASRQTTNLALKMTPVISSLYITSSPSGALVYIDNTYAGVTPLSSDKLTLGQHMIELKREGYETKTDFISVTSKNKVSRSYLLVPKTGSLLVTTSQEGLDVYVDNVLKGTSPLKLDNLTPGRYKVSTKSETYSNNPLLDSLLQSLSGSGGAVEQYVDVEAGKTTEVFLGSAKEKNE